MAVSDERSLLPAGFRNPSVIFGTASEYTIASRSGGRCGRLNIGRGSPPPGTAPSQCPHVDGSVLRTSASPATGEGRTGTLSRRP
jgi:hypothetical protein